MTVAEAREVFGFRKDDVPVKSGLEVFRRAYKNVLKDHTLPFDMRKVYENNLNAVEVLLSGADSKEEVIPVKITPKKPVEQTQEEVKAVEPKKQEAPKPKKQKEDPNSFVSLFV